MEDPRPQRLVVVLGAGASADCASNHVWGIDPAWKPPLVKDLFAPRSSFAGVLNRYPMAQFAAADIRRLNPQATSIEQFLRENYEGGTSELTKRKFLSVPLYLQELLLEVSFRFTPQADNYDLLISNTIDGLSMEAFFVTLNYDLLLDLRLNHLAPLLTLDDYIGTERSWSLIKLHGSVDWGRRIHTLAPRDHRDPPPHTEAYQEIVLARGPLSDLDPGSLNALRERSIPPYGESHLFPALSVPLGEQDELSCPDTHVNFFQQHLQLSSGIHLLVIGYSGIDLEVLGLIKNTSAEIKSTMIVNRNLETATEVYQRLNAQLARSLGEVELFESTFNDFVQREGWEQYRQLLRRAGASDT